MDRLPPYGELLRLRVDREGDAFRLVMPYHDDVVGRPGFLHGGAIAGLLEFAAYDVLREALGTSSVRLKPVNVSLDFLRGGTARDTYAGALIKRLGRRIAHVEAAAWQEDETRPIATARMNVLLGRVAGIAG